MVLGVSGMVWGGVVGCCVVCTRVLVLSCDLFKWECALCIPC